MRFTTAAVWLMVGPLFLLLAWDLVAHIDEKIDLFPFRDFVQKPKWYVHYSAYHVNNICQAALIWLLIRRYGERRLKLTATVLLFFAIFRLLEYWLFRHMVPFEGIVAGVAFISLGTYFYKRKK